MRNSILHGGGNLIGYMGQIVVAEHFFGWFEPDTYDFDVVALNATRLDVKTKERAGPCYPGYEFSVAAANVTQKCHGYLPLSVYTDRASGLYVVEIMGWITKEEFEATAIFRRKGEPEPNMARGEIRADCYNLPYSALHVLAPPLIQV